MKNKMANKLKYYHCIYHEYIHGQKCFHLDLKNQEDIDLLDSFGMKQEIININIKHKHFTIDKVDCLVYSRFANGKLYKVIPVGIFLMSYKSKKYLEKDNKYNENND